MGPGRTCGSGLLFFGVVITPIGIYQYMSTSSTEFKEEICTVVTAAGPFDRGTRKFPKNWCDYEVTITDGSEFPVSLKHDTCTPPGGQVKPCFAVVDEGAVTELLSNFRTPEDQRTHAIAVLAFGIGFLGFGACLLFGEMFLCAAAIARSLVQGSDEESEALSEKD
eukprot:TRINITY_DN44265_c0_g1_i1.p1 TRINITY_DN44265_c0_g1~~TRINITY_DN44265_c0_g1_i1.p1  ORF type:complete len:166 (+),score=17.27 TRINITY_DN44265_c0_g1_i1:65-562(+)